MKSMLAGLVVFTFLLGVAHAKEIPNPTEPIGQNQIKLTDRNIDTTVDARKYDACFIKWSSENAKCKKEHKECLKNILPVDPACTGQCAKIQEILNALYESSCNGSLLSCSTNASIIYHICLYLNLSVD